MKTTALALAVLALFGAFVAYMAREAHAGADPAAMDAMSIDMDTDGNSATVLGTRQSCQRIDEDNIVSADETSIDTLTFDVTATNIPVTNRMIGFSYQLSYDESALTIQSADDGFLLESTPGSSLFGGNDVTPDTNNDDSFTGSALDTADFMTVPPEAGSGILQRHTISSDFGAPTGQYAIAFAPASAAVHINPTPASFAANAVNNGTISIGEACGGAPPTPTPSPTPSPTASPTASATASPTASPTMAASPTATPTTEPTVGPSETPGGPTPTPTQTPGPTDTPGPTGTGAPTPTPTPTPVPTPLPTGVTPAPTATATPVPTPLPSGVTPAPTPTASPLPSSTPAASETPGPSGSPVGKPKGSVDCDQDVDSIDALHVLRFVGGLGESACIAVGDVDCDGDRDAADALKILRHVADLIVALPDGCMPIGAMTA